MSGFYVYGEDQAEAPMPELTSRGLRYKSASDYARSRDLYEEYRGDPIYEDSEVVIFIDYSGNDIPELADMTGKETVQLIRTFAAIVEDRVPFDDRGFFEYGYAIVLRKPGGD
jgi:hypothetical protein